jgi:hypothetical protein
MQRTAMIYNAREGQNPELKLTKMASAKDTMPNWRRYLIKML